MINPNNPIDRERLKKARDWSWDQMKSARETHKRLVRQYAGRVLGGEGGEKKKMMNLSWQTASAIVTSLVPRDVRFQVEALKADPSSVSFARQFQLHLNEICKKAYLSRTIASCILDSWFAPMGICYLHMQDSLALELEQDLFLDPGTPGMTHVSIHDYVQDMSVRRRSHRTFEGHNYEVSWSALREIPNINKSIVDNMQRKGSDYLYNSERPKDDETGAVDDDSRVEPVVKLVDVFLPRERLIATFPHRLDTPPLRVLKSEFSDCGPYPHLSYDEVPDQLLPIAPAEHGEEIDKLINSDWRKLAKQARRCRIIGFYESGHADTAKAVKSADDGDFVLTKRKESIGHMNIPGPDPALQQFTMWAGDQYNELLGNPRALIGSGPQSETAAQDQMIHNQVSGMMQRRQERVREFVADIGNGFADLLWQDNTIREAYDELETNPDIKVVQFWGPKREGERASYKIDVSPYTMPNRTPQQTSQMLQAMVSGQFMQLMPFAQQAGRQFQFDEYVDMLAELESCPRIKRLWGIAEPQEPPGGMRDGPGKPANTQRTYLRKSMGVQDRSGGALRSELAGAAAQQNQVMVQ